MQFDHLALPVADLERAERFYAEVLGLERLMRLPDQVLFKMGSVNLGLMQTANLEAVDPSILKSPLGKAHHAFRVDRAAFEVWRRKLAAARVPMSEVVDWGDHRCFYFIDPDGNLLELVTPPEADRSGPVAGDE